MFSAIQIYLSLSLSLRIILFLNKNINKKCAFCFFFFVSQLVYTEFKFLLENIFFCKFKSVAIPIRQNANTEINFLFFLDIIILKVRIRYSAVLVGSTHLKIEI